MSAYPYATPLLLAMLLLPASAWARWYFVAPQGSDANTGHTVNTPFEHVQKALEYAMPGDTVVLLPGRYLQDIRTRRGGDSRAPIQIRGSIDAVVLGAGGARIIEINHSHIELIGFSVDGGGQTGGAIRDKLIYVEGDPTEGITGVRLLGLKLANAGGECIRMKSMAHDNEIAYNQISRCGIDDFERKGKGKNGEAVYLGTAPEQWDHAGMDASNGNHVHHNHISSHGSECVDIKEGARLNLIEHNLCSDQKDPDSAGISIRGNDNIVRFNAVGPSIGAGIRIGGDRDTDGRGNSIYGNQLHHNRAGSVKLMNLGQHMVCENELRQPKDFPAVRTIDKSLVDVTTDCPSGLEGVR